MPNLSNDLTPAQLKCRRELRQAIVDSKTRNQPQPICDFFEKNASAICEDGAENLRAALYAIAIEKRSNLILELCLLSGFTPNFDDLYGIAHGSPIAAPYDQLLFTYAKMGFFLGKPVNNAQGLKEFFQYTTSIGGEEIVHYHPYCVGVLNGGAPLLSDEESNDAISVSNGKVVKSHGRLQAIRNEHDLLRGSYDWNHLGVLIDRLNLIFPYVSFIKYVEINGIEKEVFTREDLLKLNLAFMSKDFKKIKALTNNFFLFNQEQIQKLANLEVALEKLRDSMGEHAILSRLIDPIEPGVKIGVPSLKVLSQAALISGQGALWNVARKQYKENDESRFLLVSPTSNSLAEQSPNNIALKNLIKTFKNLDSIVKKQKNFREDKIISMVPSVLLLVVFSSLTFIAFSIAAFFLVVAFTNLSLPFLGKNEKLTSSAAIIIGSVLGLAGQVMCVVATCLGMFAKQVLREQNAHKEIFIEGDLKQLKESLTVMIRVLYAFYLPHKAHEPLLHQPIKDLVRLYVKLENVEHADLKALMSISKQFVTILEKLEELNGRLPSLPQQFNLQQGPQIDDKGEYGNLTILKALNKQYPKDLPIFTVFADERKRQAQSKVGARMQVNQAVDASETTHLLSFG